MTLLLEVREPEATDVMEALEAAVPVALVMSSHLEFAQASDPANEALKKLKVLHFDCMPVREQGRVVGVLERASAGTAGTVRDIMRPLADNMLVATTDPLLALIEVLDEQPGYRLALKGGAVCGIVTISDLQRLAVRSLLFSRITHVELLLAKWLRRHCTVEGSIRHETWLGCLSAGRRGKLDAKLVEWRRRNMDLDPLTASDFCDKRVAALELGAFSDARISKKQLEGVEVLRDQVAHASNYAETREAAHKTIRAVRDARKLITELSQRLARG